MVADRFDEEIKKRNRIACSLCSHSINSIDDAVETGWIPSYFDDRDEERGPACPDCCRQYLRFDQETQTYERIGRLN